MFWCLGPPVASPFFLFVNAYVGLLASVAPA
jgi:hypothetical protein